MMHSAVAAAVVCVRACVRERVCVCVYVCVREPDERAAGCRLEAALVRFDCETPPPSSTLTEPLSLRGLTGLDDVRIFIYLFILNIFCGGVISGCLYNDDM